MSAPVPPAPMAAVDRDHLATLAEIVDASVPLAASEPAQLVRLRAAPAATDLAADELEVGFRPIGGDHPLDDLIGFVAPDDWCAIGLVGTGRAMGPDDQTPFPVRTVHLVARGGAWVSRWQPLDRPGPGPAPAAGAVESGDGQTGAAGVPAGRIDDALRRALGVATAPPPATTIRLWALEWLHRLLAAAADSPTRRRRLRPLASILGLHPVVDAFDLDPRSLDLAEVVEQAHRLAAWRNWSQLRRSCASGSWPNPEVDAELAAWLDDGAFARWVLAGWPELDDLRSALAVLLAPSAVSVVDDALASWGLLDPNGLTGGPRGAEPPVRGFSDRDPKRT